MPASPPTARWSSPTTRRCAAASAGCACRTSTAADLAKLDVPRLADLYETCGVDYELSVDLKDREVVRPLIEVARAAGGGAPGRLWVCTASLKLLEKLRDEAPDVKLVYSPGRNRVAPAAMERHAADLAAQGVDCLNLHYSEWTRGLVALFHRFEPEDVRLGHPGDPLHPRRAAPGHGRHLLRPRRPHGRHRRRVDHRTGRVAVAALQDLSTRSRDGWGARSA